MVRLTINFCEEQSLNNILEMYDHAVYKIEKWCENEYTRCENGVLR